MRRAAMVAGGALVLVALIVAVLHTPPVRRGVAGVIEARLAAAGIASQIGAIRYNLLDLEVEVDDLRLRAVAADDPFLEAAALRVDLPWSVIFGDLGVESIELVDAHVRLIRGADGGWNVPGAGETATEAEPGMGEAASEAAPVALPRIGRLVLDNTRVDIVDAVSGVGLELPVLNATAEALADEARLSLGSAGTLRFRDRTMPVSAVSGGFAWDGVSLTLRQVAVELAAGTLTIDGTLDDVGAEPTADLQIGVAVALEEIGAFLDLADVPAGEVRLSGRVSGALAAPAAAIEIDSGRLAWREIEASEVNAQLTVSGETVVLEDLRARVADGTVSGRGEMGYGPGDGEDTPGSLHFELDSVAGWQLSGVAGEDTPRLASELDAVIDLSWPRWPADDPAALTGQATLTARRAGAEVSGLPLEGSVELSLDAGDWRLSGDPRLAGALVLDADLQGRLADPLAESTLGGTLQITSPDLSRLPRALDDMVAAMPELTGSGRAVLRLDGTVSRPGFEGPLELERPGLSDIVADRLTGRLSGSPSAVGIDNLVIERNRDRVTGNARVDLDTRGLGGNLTATIVDLPGLLPADVASMISADSLLVEGALGGTLDAPRFEVMARGSDVRAAGQPRVDVEARGILDGDVLRVEELVARQAEPGQAAGSTGSDPLDLSDCRSNTPAPGCLRISATWDLTAGDLAVQGLGRGVRVEPVVIDGAEVPVRGTFDLDIDGGHDAGGLAGEATMAATGLTLYGLEPGPVRLTATGAGDGVELHATAADLATVLEGRLASDGDFELRGELDGLPVQRLLPTSGRELDARLGAGFVLAGNLRGGQASAGETADAGISLTGAALELRDLEGTLDGVPLRLLEPGTIELAGETLRTDGVALGLGNAVLRVSGAFPAEESPLVVALTGDLADLESLAVLAVGTTDEPAALAMSGALDVRIELAGTADAPRATGSLQVRDGEVATGDIPAVRGLDIEARLDDGLVVVLDNLAASWQEAELTATGRLPLALFDGALPLPGMFGNLPRAGGPASLDARVGPLGPQALRPFLAAETVDAMDGRIVAHLTVSSPQATLAALEGSLVLEEADVAVGGARLEQRSPTRIDIADGRLLVRDLRWGGLGTELRVTGSAPLSGSSDVNVGDPDDRTGELELQARGTVDLRFLQLLLPGAAAGGTGELGIDLTGTLAEPELAGGVDIRNAELRIPAARVAFLDVTGRIALDGSTVVVEPVAGQLNGGAFVLTGELPPDAADDAPGGQLELTAVDVALQPIDGLRSLVDLGLRLDLSEGMPGRLDGTVTITRGSYRERMSVVGGLLEQARGVAAAAPGAAGGESALDDLLLDLRIVTESDVLVDNNLAELALAADLRLTGTLGAPGVTGRAEILSGGTVFLGGNRFRVEDGAIDFVSARAVEPEFDISALTRVNDYEVTLRITGTPEEPDLELTSDPPLSEPDIASLLVTGRTLERAESTQATVAQEQLVGLLAAEFTGQLGEAIGLDSVRLERGPVQDSFRTYPSIIATETDPAQRLTMSKSLRPDLDLVFSQSLGSSGGFTWLVDYEIIRDLEAEALFDDEDNRALQIGQRLTFGGGETLVRRSADTGPPATVTAVIIEGDSPLAEAELRDTLRLRPGDAFDFFRWQDDRERLIELHRERGLLEVRVDATRGGGVADAAALESDPASERLVYTVAAGPRTTLVATGIELSDDSRARIDTAWAQSVLDDFLLDEARAIVRVDLARRGFVVPRIEASIDAATPGEKRLVLRVDPGPRSDRLQLDVTGNRRLDAEYVNTVLQQIDPPETAWIDPQAAAGALRAAYAAAGMPEAEVVVGDPRREGEMAVLPVEVVEGPLYRVGTIRFAGVGAISAVELEALLPVVTGEPYVASRITAARRALESLYRSRGYTAAEVALEAAGLSDAAPVADTGADAAVDVPVTFQIREGPLETVAAIEVDGAVITHAGIIDRVLGLEIGDPADRNVLAQARRRLYNTGAFRRVGIEVEPTGPEEAGAVPVRVVVSVGERAPYVFRYGLRLNSLAPLEEATSRQYEPGVAGELTSNNLLGRTLSAGVAARYQPDFRIGRVFLTTPRFFGLPLISSVFFSRSQEQLTVEFFGLERTDIIDFTDVTLEQRFTPFEGALVAYSYNFQRVHTAEKGADPDDPFSFPIIIDVSRLALSGLLDRRDDPFDATRGWFHSSILEYSATALGSDLPFAKYLAQQYYYHPIGRVTLASALRFGVAAAFDGQELIRSERFFAGGGNSVRGYEEDSLGPTDFFGPTGGNTLLELKQEVRFPIAWWFRGVGFVDAGNAFATLGDLSLGGLAVGTGFGLRVDTPFALLRLDYGFALDREPGAPGGQFFFSLGQAF